MRKEDIKGVTAGNHVCDKAASQSNVGQGSSQLVGLKLRNLQGMLLAGIWSFYHDSFQKAQSHFSC